MQQKAFDNTQLIGVNGLLNVAIPANLPGAARRHLGLLHAFADSPPVEGRPTLSLETTSKKPTVSNGMSKVDNFYYLNENRLIDRSSYKWSRWTTELVGIDQMQQVTMSVFGDFFSSWVWPYRTLGAVIRMMLGHQQAIVLHAAGYPREDGGASLMLAPSGTGKTLTSLHWLCEGRAYYGDDCVIMANGRLHAMNTLINYWPHRYKGGDALPRAMPPLHRDQKRRLSRSAWLRRLSAGQVGFGASMDAKAYWPGCLAPPRRPDRLVVLEKSDRFIRHPNYRRQAIKYRILADLRYQALPVLRWALCARLAQPTLWLARWEAIVEEQVDALLDTVQIISVGVPAAYDKRVYEQLREILA